MTMQVQEEATDSTNNGQVTIELTITDEVMNLGILTELISIESEKSFVTDELADHLMHEYHIDVEEHGIEIVE